RRPLWLVLIFLLTAFFAWEMSTLKVDSSFEKMLPMQHPYLKNMWEHKEQLSQKGFSFKVVVENNQGDIFDKEYLQMLEEVHTQVALLNGIDRVSLKSLFAPTVRWLAVTPEGFQGDGIIPGSMSYGTPEALEQIKINLLRSPWVGILVGDNFKSSSVEAFVQFNYPDDSIETDEEGSPLQKRGEPIDFQDFGHRLEKIRSDILEKYGDKYSVYIIGEPKMLGDLIDGFNQIILFGGVALVITVILLYLYAHCWVSALAPLFTSILAVVWQLGILAAMAHFGLKYGNEEFDVLHGIGVFSMLVPFLIVAIGVSHSVQFVNAMALEASHGYDAYGSARRAFRSNYLPGMTALITDGLGFVTMLLIPIGAIKELSIAASVGIIVIILLKLMLLPIIMSYVGISKRGVNHMQAVEQQDPWHWRFLANFTQPKWAAISIVIASAMAVVGIIESRGLQIGDTNPGVPELRPDSIYNLDNDYVTRNYATSSDLFVVMAVTKDDKCFSQPNLDAMDRLEWALQNVEGVQATVSAAYIAKNAIMGVSEGHLKWFSLGRDQLKINEARQPVSEIGMIDELCNFAPIVAYLTDHKAKTLDRVAQAVEDFAKENNTSEIEFKLATGNAGIAAAVNSEIKDAQSKMMWLVYGVVAAMVMFTYPSVASVLCILLPLAFTSVLCEALMARMGIGIKVATLPVIALGVGIGVDYGIYVYSRMETCLKAGQSLRDAYMNTLKSTGKAVSFTGLTLAIGVGTWYFSDIQYQKDMGFLLLFMFLWNMVGALWLLPSLACFLVNKKKYPAARPKKA
ncbi:MAG: RND family transporter, partial [Pseudomonadales bacterium]|nr:RND family transporter [Pseudomonadales bacterium]